MADRRSGVVVQDIRRYHALVDRMFDAIPVSYAVDRGAQQSARFAHEVLIYLYRLAIHDDEPTLKGFTFNEGRGIFALDRQEDGGAAVIFATARSPWAALSYIANQNLAPSLENFVDPVNPHATEAGWFQVAPSAMRQLRALWEWAEAEELAKGWTDDDGVLHTNYHEALRGREPINDLLARYDIDPEMKRLTDRILSNAGLAGLGAAPKGTPTELNVSVMSDYFGPHTRIPNKIEATSVPHLRRCMNAGYIVPEGRELVLTPAGERALTEYRRVNFRWMEQYERNLARLKKAGLSGLDAAPGDVDGFVRETVEAAIVHIERAFQRAGLTVVGKPLGARAVGRWVPMNPDTGPQREALLDRDDGFQRRATDAYAWIARQFARGATGQGFLDPRDNDPWLEDETLDFTDSWNAIATPEGRLGLDVWRIGRNVAAEARAFRDSSRFPDDERYERDVLDRILESVRTRLNWPRLPGDYDPPPPSEWPEDA